MIESPDTTHRDSVPTGRERASNPTGEQSLGSGLVEELAGLREVVRSLAVLQVARGKVALERSGLALARLVLFGVAGVVLVASTVVLVVVGSVGGVAAATGWPLWLAALALGIIGPMLAAGLTLLVLRRRDASRAKALEERTNRPAKTATNELGGSA